MKTAKQIDAARAVMRRRIITPGLTDVQKATVMGVSNALQWAAGVGNTTMDLLLSETPMAAGQDSSRVMERLSRLPNTMQAMQLLIEVDEQRPGWRERVREYVQEHTK